jgi:hypothetical protein
MVRRRWSGDADTEGAAPTEADEIREVFSLSVNKTPRWLRRWRRDQQGVLDDVVRIVLEDVWTLCCATTITAVWRWNVDRIHQAERWRPTLEGATAVLTRQVSEAMARYRLGLYPLTAQSHGNILVAEALSRWWNRDLDDEQHRRGKDAEGEQSRNGERVPNGSEEDEMGSERKKN